MRQDNPIQFTRQPPPLKRSTPVPPAKPLDLPTLGRVLSKAGFKKLVLMKLLASPWTLTPFVIGATILLAVWALSIVSGPAIFVGLTAVLGSVGALVTRYLLGGESLVNRIVAEIEAEVQRERDQALDGLDARLARIRDTRPRAALRDLRALMKAFYGGRTWTDSGKVSPTLDILSKVEELFRQCVFSLEKTLELWYTAQEMSTEEAKEPILKHRETIIKEIFESVKKLGEMLVGIQTLDLGDPNQDSGLFRIRQDLDQSLEVARAVEKRMQSLDQEIYGSGVSQPEGDRPKEGGDVQ